MTCGILRERYVIYFLNGKLTSLTYTYTQRQFKKTYIHNKHDVPAKRGNTILSWSNRKMPPRTSSMIFFTI